MADETKVKSVAEAVRRAKKGPAKKRSSKKAPKSKSKTKTKLSVSQLNEKEELVLSILNGAGSGIRLILTIAELAETCFKSQGPKQSNSWVRNSLRRLVQQGLVEKTDRGKYRVSDAGRRGLAKAA